MSEFNARQGLSVGVTPTVVLDTTGNATLGTVSGSTITATTQFSGPATGLTGTAASLTAGAVSSISSSQVSTALGFTPLSTAAQAADSLKLNGQAASYYAVDSAVAHLSGAETLAGVKTFSSTMIGSLDSSSSGTLNLGVSNASVVNIGTATTTQTVNIGTGSGVTTINLGGSGDTVNITGTLAYVNTTDLTVTDKLITINKGGASASGNASGLAVEENGSITGYAEVGNTRASWVFSAPASSGTIMLTPGSGAYSTEIISSATDNRQITLPNATGTVALTSGVPSASSTTPVMDGTAAVGTGTTFARADHVHPTDTSRQAALSGTGFVKSTSGTISYDTNTYALSSAVPTASSTTPAMDGTAAVGTGTTFARADHVHPSDTAKQNVLSGTGFVKSTSGTISYDTNTYLTTSGTAADSSKLGGTAAASYALAANIPSASSTTPVMDGTAAVGTGSTFARADHVHPSDTSRARLTTNTFTGKQTFCSPSTSTASFIIPNGSADPTTPVSGDVWANSGAMKWYNGTASRSFAFLDSPTFTGTPAAPTAAADTSTTQIATTAYVVNQGYLKSTTAASTYLGISATAADSSKLGGTAAASYALAANIPSASSTTPVMDGTAAVGSGTTFARADHVHPTDTSRQATLSGTGFVKSTSGTISYDTSTYLTANQTITCSGDATGSGTTAIALTLASSGVTSGTYGTATTLYPITVDAKGRITAVGSATTIAPAWSSVTSKPTTTSGLGLSDLTGLSSTSPVMDGTATVGTSTLAAHGDHVHPTDTSRAALTTNTFTGKQTLCSPSTSTSSFLLPNGSADPTTPVSGDMWANTGVIKWYNGSATRSVAFLDSPAFTGTPTSTTAAADTSTTQIATTAYVVNQGYLKSTTAASTYLGISATAADSSKLGGTAAASYALAANIPSASSTTPAMDGAAAVGTGTTWARADHIHPTDTTRQASYTLLTTFGSLASAAGWLYNNGSGTLSYSSPTKSTVGLANVENTALSTWVGTSNITTLGTIATGVWHGTAIADSYIASAATWTAKQAAYTILTTFGSLSNAGGWLYNNGSGTLSYSTPTAAQVGADASGAASSAVSTHAALQTGVHGISVTSGKTFSCSNTLTLAGTDSSTLNIGAGGTLGTGAFTAAYSLPTATSSVLGGVKPDGTSILNTSGVLSATPTSIGALASATNDNATSTACYPVWVTAAGNTVSGISASTFTFIPSTGTLNITTLQATGNVIAYNSSDSRLKENIAPLDSPLEKLSKIRGVSFDWTDAYIAKQGGEDGFFVRKHDVGVIAQEIQKVIPEAVGEHPDGYLGVRYEKLVPLLIEAIKAQQVQIDDLKKQIARLA